ncbi:MAG TPA: hypothetical protein VF771_00190 [Longimicrobiaceae bacterium]
MRRVAKVLALVSAANGCAVARPAPMPADCYLLGYGDPIIDRNQPRLIGFFPGRDSVVVRLPPDALPSPMRHWAVYPGRGDSVNVVLADGPTGWALTLALTPDSASGEGHPIMDVTPPGPVPRIRAAGPRVSCSAFAER